MFGSFGATGHPPWLHHKNSPRPRTLRRSRSCTARPPRMCCSTLGSPARSRTCYSGSRGRWRSPNTRGQCTPPCRIDPTALACPRREQRCCIPPRFAPLRKSKKTRFNGSIATSQGEGERSSNSSSATSEGVARTYEQQQQYDENDGWGGQRMSNSSARRARGRAPAAIQRT